MKPFSAVSRYFMFSYLKITLKTMLFLLITNSVYGQWVRKADEVSKRAEANNVLYHNKLYVFGGFGDNPVIEKTNEVYDIATNKWIKIASFPVGKEITHNGIILIDDNVWIIGGRLVDAHGPVGSQVIIYNITRNTWSDGPELIDPSTGKPFPLGGGGYGLLGRTIHVFGGFGPTICEDQGKLHLTLDIDKYLADPQRVTWENKSAPLPIPRNHISYVVLGGKIYAFGGQFKHDCGAVDQKYCHVYDPVNNSWTRLTDLPIVRSHAEAATFAIDGKIYLVAGQGVNNVTQNTVYQFTPQANNGLGSWTNLSAFKLPGSFLGLSSKLAGKSFIITNGALSTYGNERKETYIASVSRTASRTLGFTTPCFTKSVNPGENLIIKNLLYVIEDSVHYNLTSDAHWLTVTRNSSGTVNLNGVDIEATVNAKDLTAGNYTGKITADGASGGPGTSFCVNLQVISESGYTVTIATNGNGSVIKTPDEPTYPADSTVMLKAVPANGWNFDKWSGDTTATANPLTLTIHSNKEITANFIQDSASSALITNIKSVTANKYELGELKTGTSYYTDREYRISAVPSILSNAPFIKTACDDKASKLTSMLSFDLSEAATVYIGYDPRAAKLPAWLTGWKLLADKIGINDPKISSLNIYSKNFPAGKVTLGANMANPAAGALCQYIVVAKAQSNLNETSKKVSTANANMNTLSVSEKNVILADDKRIDNVKPSKPILFPNPAHGNLKIVFPGNYKGVAGLRVIDINGKTTTIERSLFKCTDNMIYLNMEPLALKPGVYALSITSIDGKRDIIRVIIE